HPGNRFRPPRFARPRREGACDLILTAGWWDRRLLVGQASVGGTGVCWWDRRLLVGQASRLSADRRGGRPTYQMQAREKPMSLTRRSCLQAGVSGLATWLAGNHEAPAADTPRSIAAAVTEFRTTSHAEVIVGRWLEGFELDGQSDKPQSRLVALYTDQTP